MEPRKSVETLEDLIEAISQHDSSDTTRMLRTLKGHISLATSKQANEILLSDLVGLRPVLRLYLGKKQEVGDFTRHTVRSYMNYFRILLEKAGKVCGSLNSPEIEGLWSPIAAALSREYGSRDIVRDAVGRRTAPNDYSEQHLNHWCEQLVDRGRHPAYIRARVHAFRKRIQEAGLSDLFPKLSFRPRNQTYGVPLERFAEPLRTQVTSLLAWKQAAYVRGRPNRDCCRPITEVDPEVKTIFRRQ